MYPTILTKQRAVLERAWQTECERILRDASLRGKAEKPEIELLREFLATPGKLIRPSLFLFGYETYRKAPPSLEVIQLAISFELLHLYLLIHDDIMDSGEMRRGKPTLHKAFEQYSRQAGLLSDHKQNGIAFAILIGDLLAAEAESLWSNWPDGESVSCRRARQRFDLLKREVCWGQYRDVANSLSPRMPERDEIIAVMAVKSGAYSIQRPLEIGALMAGKVPEEIIWMKEFGLNLGIAFQIVDDLLGVFGDPSVTGKSSDSDLTERKRTLLAHFALHDAGSEERAALTRFYRIEPTTNSSVSDSSELSPTEVRTIMRGLGVESKVREVAHEYLGATKQALVAELLPTSYTQELCDFAEFVVNRMK